MDAEGRQAVASFRFQVIAPLVTEPLGRGEFVRRLDHLARQSFEIPGSRRTHINRRTLQRWVQLYRKGGLAALQPTVRTDHNRPKAITPGVLDAAIALRRESPGRSVEQIIAILELSGKVARGSLKRSTLAHHLVQAGCTRTAVLQAQTRRTFRRWEAGHRNEVWQGDAKTGFWLPGASPSDRRRQVYLLAWIDDHSRAAYGQFYPEERGPRLEDCLKRTILRYGVPRRIYVDNGAIYSSHHLLRVCGRLGIRLTHSRPYRPMGRGKIERFFRFVDQAFMPEAQALIREGKLTTLAELNEFFWAWLVVGYNQRRHGSTGQTPLERWNQDSEPVRRIDPVALREAFLWEELRQVDKTGCFALHGNTYEVDTALAQRKVALRYDPYDLGQIQVWLDEQRYPDATPVQLRCRQHRAVQPPEPAPPSTGLNFLSLAKKQHAEQIRQELGQTPYHRLTGGKEGNPDAR